MHRIFIAELYADGLYDQTNQAFAVFLPVRSVAVTGDGRRYDHVVAVRAVETVDFMTALDSAAVRVRRPLRAPHYQQVPTISRGTYDISGKPLVTMEWERGPPAIG